MSKISKIRVAQLAKELGLSNREVIECLVRAGVSVKSRKSFVDEAPARAALSTEEILEAPASPSAPPVVTIPEMITVKELSEKVATSPGDIIKTLMKRGITATLNQNLHPELARQVAVECGATVAVIPFEEAEEHRRAAHVGLPDIPWLERSTAIRGRWAAVSEGRLPSATDGWTASSYLPKHKGWLLTSAIAALMLLFLVVPREKETPSIEVTPAVVDEGQRNAAIPSAKAASSPTRDARTYRKDIQPLIAAYCGTCHAPKGVAGGVPLRTYRDVRQYVEPGRSDNSPLYTFIQERRNHVNPWPRSWGHTTNDKLAVIRDWIDVNRAAE